MKIKKSGSARRLLALCILALLALRSAPGDAGAQAWSKPGNLPLGTRSIAIDANASTLYALGSEGISRSSDGGASWALCNRDARSMRLVATESPAGLLYATTQAGPRQSDDGCRTWKDVPTQGILPSGDHVRWLAPYPNNPRVLYAGMDGLGGLYRSTDAGATWQPASSGLPSGAWITALTADPQRPERILVGLRYAGRNTTPAFVYASADGGLTWRSSSLGLQILPNNGGHIVGFAWSGETLVAATGSDGLYASTDRGASWRPATLPRRASASTAAAGLAAPQLPLAISGLASNASGVLLISTPEGLFQSLDGARSWQSFGPGSARGTQVLIGTDGAANRLVLGASGHVWSSQVPAAALPTPTATPPVVAQLSPTPPPPVHLPTSTPVPPTPTTKPLPTATATVVLVQGPLPTDRTQPFDPSVSDYFEQTGHNIKYGFRDYWLNNGGLRLFGYPLTEEFVENGVTVQYFERVRLEYHNKNVVWGLLGTELTAGHFYQSVPFFPSQDNNVYFGPTQHSVSGPFLDFWRSNGGLATFGFPLSESFKADGSEYQWFERARFEWHSDLPEGKRIVLGNIGTEALKKRGWIK